MDRPGQPLPEFVITGPAGQQPDDDRAVDAAGA